MIKRYTDHSANERTYLAWIRTAIAIMAFGFLIEKFELFIAYLGHALAEPGQFQSSLSAQFIAIGLFILGAFMIISATCRFFIYKKAIESEQDFPYSVRRTNIILSSLIIAIALFLIFYISQQIII